jgi:hypothetical protein
MMTFALLVFIFWIGLRLLHAAFRDRQPRRIDSITTTISRRAALASARNRPCCSIARNVVPLRRRV